VDEVIAGDQRIKLMMKSRSRDFFTAKNYFHRLLSLTQQDPPVMR